MDMAREKGLPRIYARDFDKYGIIEITGTPEADEPDSSVDEEVAEEPKKEEQVKTEEVKADKTAEKKAKKTSEDNKPKAEKKVYTMEELVKMSIEDFSKYVRKIDTDEVIKFAGENGVETFADVEDDRIRRMKLVMELKKKYFPNQSVPTKKSSFKGVDTKTLMKFADEKNVEYKTSSEDKIQKMWVIYALNKAGFYDLPNKDGDDEDRD